MLTTFRQEIFCQNVAKGSRHKDAAIAAGYSQRTASCIGAQLAKMPLVAARIQELREAELKVKVALVTREAFLQQITDYRGSTEPVTIVDGTGEAVGVFLPLDK